MTNLLLISLTMTAFALNSVLNRVAVAGGHADPAGFAVLRVAAGALVLAVLLLARSGRFETGLPRRWWGAVALALYMIGFSLAYRNLDAGLGALILFGTVQIALFAYGALREVAPNVQQITGAAVAFGGLILALWSGEGGSLAGAVLMVAAGLGWAGYTVAGRGAADPVAATATQFLLCLPLMLPMLLMPGLHLSAIGVVLAVLSGGVTSGLGYALWYRVLPSLPGARAAVVQLSVPVIAIALGAALLGEALSLRVILAAALVLGGIGWALRPAR